MSHLSHIVVVECEGKESFLIRDTHVSTADIKHLYHQDPDSLANLKRRHAISDEAIEEALTFEKWLVVDYEFEMFFAAFEYLRIGTLQNCMLSGLREELRDTLKNITVEATMLHLRLIWELTRKNASERDDILLCSMVSEEIGSQWKDAQREFLVNYGKRDRRDSPYTVINKGIVHNDCTRGNSGDYTTVLTTMFPLVCKVRDALVPALPELIQQRWTIRGWI